MFIFSEIFVRKKHNHCILLTEVGNWRKLLWLQTVYMLTIVITITLCITSAFICLHIRTPCYDIDNEYITAAIWSTKDFYIIIIIIITQFLMRHMSVKVWRNRRRDYIDLLIQNHDFDLDSILAKPDNFDFDA